MPRVTVLLTCYNHIKYLPECLESVMAQTFTDYEIIALDDGSTDGTREWLSARPEPMTLVFNEQNLGTYPTLNVGLERATGEFIAVLNDDDVWAPTKLEKQVALMDANPKVGLVHTDGYFLDGESNRTEGSPLGFHFPRTETGDILLALVYSNQMIASAALARKQCFEDLGGFNPAFFGSGDWEMWYRIAEKWDVGYCKDELTMYRIHGANASHKLDKIWKDDQMLREWIAPRLAGYKGRFSDHDLREAEAHNLACLGTVQALNGNPSAARQSYAASVKVKPGRWKSYLRYVATYLPRETFRKLIYL